MQICACWKLEDLSHENSTWMILVGCLGETILTSNLIFNNSNFHSNFNVFSIEMLHLSCLMINWSISFLHNKWLFINKFRLYRYLQLELLQNITCYLDSISFVVKRICTFNSFLCSKIYRWFVNLVMQHTYMHVLLSREKLFLY